MESGEKLEQVLVDDPPTYESVVGGESAITIPPCPEAPSAPPISCGGIEIETEVPSHVTVPAPRAPVPTPPQEEERVYLRCPNCGTFILLPPKPFIVWQILVFVFQSILWVLACIFLRIIYIRTSCFNFDEQRVTCPNCRKVYAFERSN